MKKIIILTFILVLGIYSTGFSSDYTYDVSGGGYSGEIESNKGEKEVEGYLYDEDGNYVSFEGEWVGKGEIEGYDENGNHVELEVE